VFIDCACCLQEVECLRKDKFEIDSELRSLSGSSLGYYQGGRGGGDYPGRGGDRRFASLSSCLMN